MHICQRTEPVQQVAVLVLVVPMHKAIGCPLCGVYLQVADNGKGVPPEDYAALALKYHTSKISQFQDLEVRFLWQCTAASQDSKVSSCLNPCWAQPMYVMSMCAPLLMLSAPTCLARTCIQSVQQQTSPPPCDASPSSSRHSCHGISTNSYPWAGLALPLHHHRPAVPCPMCCPRVSAGPAHLWLPW